jgi:hypothetical protein
MRPERIGPISAGGNVADGSGVGWIVYDSTRPASQKRRDVDEMEIWSVQPDAGSTSLSVASSMFSGQTPSMTVYPVDSVLL